MEVGYVVPYVNEAEACHAFWVEAVGMVEKRRTRVGDVTVAQVGFSDQAFAFGRGVRATDVGEHPGMRSLAFADPEGRWFAVTA